MLDVIICANFGVKKLRGLGNTRGQILEFPIEMVGHLCNRAGATTQPVTTPTTTTTAAVATTTIQICPMINFFNHVKCIF